MFFIGRQKVFAHSSGLKDFYDVKHVVFFHLKHVAFFHFVWVILKLGFCNQKNSIVKIEVCGKKF